MHEKEYAIRKGTNIVGGKRGQNQFLLQDEGSIIVQFAVFVSLLPVRCANPSYSFSGAVLTYSGGGYLIHSCSTTRSIHHGSRCTRPARWSSYSRRSPPPGKADRCMSQSHRRPPPPLTANPTHRPPPLPHLCLRGWPVRGQWGRHGGWRCGWRCTEGCPGCSPYRDGA